MYPQPEGFPLGRVLPDRATFQPELGLFVLRESDLRELDEPEAAVLDFLESTYEAGADLAGWDRASLEATQRTTERPEGLPWPPPQPPGHG